MKPTVRLGTVEVTADGERLVSHAGVALLAELADRSGLTEALCDAVAETRERRSRHDPGRVMRALALMLCDGGDCVQDLAGLRGQGSLFGPVASETTAHRVLKSIDGELLDGLRRARARARAAAWQAGARPERIVLDIDATLVSAQSEKEDAAGNWKGGFGFHPLLCFLDGTAEGLAGLLRPGNAGSNTAADHEHVLVEALEQLPRQALDEQILVRCDVGGATHEFTETCRDAEIRFSVRYELTESVRQALLALPESAWQAALDGDGEDREGAWVAELSHAVELSGWPAGARLIVRRERPHPGAQLSFSDAAGHRFTSFLTDQQDDNIAALELRHRRRARVEDRIRCAKDTGLEKLPFHAFAHNEVWLERVLIAQDLFAWAAGFVLERLASPRRAQATAPPPVAHRRSARPLRTAHTAAPGARLALDRGARGRLQAPAGTAARRSALTALAASAHPKGVNTRAQWPRVQARPRRAQTRSDTRDRPMLANPRPHAESITTHLTPVRQSQVTLAPLPADRG